MSESGVDVTVDDEVLSSSPICDHGPTLLFERKNKKGRFYACSACRDRKDCRFFMWEEDHRKRRTTSTTDDAAKEGSKHRRECVDDGDRLKTILKLAANRRRLCRKCWLLLLPSEWKEHDGHPGMDVPLTEEQLTSPTLLLEPLDNNKKEAQYFFTKRTTDFLVSTLKSLEFTDVLCIGCPRIHERLCKDEKNVNSFLLDIDERFRQFYSSTRFVRYNMFNHHFFDEGDGGRETYDRFLRDSSSLAVVVDPPFGGLVAPLVHTLVTIGRNIRASKEDSSVAVHLPRFIWIFPYFMEKMIAAAMPDVAMLDYKVDYENHSSFKVKEGTGLRTKSPIRIFTNISPAAVVLPQNEGYRFCEKCRRYVAPENNHCNDCDSCTSKVTHCDRHNRD